MDVPRLIEDHVSRGVPDPGAAPRGVRLRQQGEIRLDPARPWLPFTAVQTMASFTTAFVWRARVRMAPLVPVTVVDAFERGAGRLDARMWGLVPVARGRGERIDRSEVQRYLAELAWCPWAMLHNPDLVYEARDERTVRVWARDPEAWVDLGFDPAGDLVTARTTTRYRNEAAEPWEGRFLRYGTFGEHRVPSRAEVLWEGADGAFSYWKADLTAFEPVA